MDDTRQELERLRDDDKKPVIGLPSDGDECALSHVIPEASSALVVSDSMHLLVDAVVSADTRRRCGFWGTGGIGKTTTSAWLCRLSRVRRYFNVIAWVALGQTPNLVACQRSLHLQLTGAELPLDISAEEKVEKLRLAFTGRDCLLVLDDVSESATAHSSSGAAHCTLTTGATTLETHLLLCLTAQVWDAQHVASFALVDEGTRSKVLMSSRVRATLEATNCLVVNIGLPTEAEAVAIMMAAAGMAEESVQSAPLEAREVAQLCKRLPLTLGIAGRMIRDLGLEQDWPEVLAMMREEAWWW